MSSVRSVPTVALVLGLLLGGAGCSKGDEQPPSPAEPTLPEAPPATEPAPTPVDDPDPAAAAEPTDEPAPGDGDQGEPGPGDEAGEPDAPAVAAAGDGKRPQNLKILPKTWTVEQVEELMKKEFKRGLGQKCSFCHDTDDFSADTNKHKRIARDMMRMTSDLNRKYFKGKNEVTCFMCHGGKKEPE